MSFFAVLFALLLEQLKPFTRGHRVHDLVAGWFGVVTRNFDAGRPHHAAVVWWAAVALPTLAALGVHLLLSRISVFAVLLFDVLLLYLALGFRQFSHYFTAIRDALERGDDEAARHHLARWQHIDTADLPRSEILRQVIGHALVAAHRHVFGVLFWFALLSALGLGPMGAVFYRLSGFAPRYWQRMSRQAGSAVNPQLLEWSQRWFALIDHVPARLTAAGFAVVGNFEEAISGWRRDASLWSDPNDGVLLASASGAVGVHLAPAPIARSSLPVAPYVDGVAPDTSGASGAAHGASMPLETAHLQSMVGLVWRSVVLWMLLLALLTLANVVG
jgi:adenosylcobinamide-phosphate synthase